VETAASTVSAAAWILARMQPAFNRSWWQLVEIDLDGIRLSRSVVAMIPPFRGRRRQLRPVCRPAGIAIQVDRQPCCLAQTRTAGDLLQWSRDATGAICCCRLRRPRSSTRRGGQIPAASVNNAKRAARFRLGAGHQAAGQVAAASLRRAAFLRSE